MHFIDSVFLENEDFKNLLIAEEKQRLPAVVTGLGAIQRACVISAFCAGTDKKAAVVCQSEAEAVKLAEDLSALGKKTLLLPERDLTPGGGVVTSREWEHKRISTLSALTDGAFSVCVGSVEAFSLYTLPPAVLRSNFFTVSQTESISPATLAQKLVSSGYVRCDQVEGAGQFAVRGGIFDIFTTDMQDPVRIEFWGDDIDSISFFDVMTQRRGDSVGHVDISPAHEVLFDEKVLFDKLSKVQHSRKKLSDKQRAVLSADCDALNAGVFTASDRYLPIIYDRPFSAFDYFDGCALFVCESGNIKERLKNLSWQQNEDVASLIEDGYLFDGCDRFYLGQTSLNGIFEQRGAIYLENFARNAYDTSVRELINMSIKGVPAWNGDFKLLLEDIGGGNTVIMAGGEKAAKVLCDELCASGIKAVFRAIIKGVPHGVTVTLGGISAGFSIPSQKMTVITHSRGSAEKKKKYKTGKSIGTLEELKAGDYVVHAVHGIGIFSGIEKQNFGGVVKDYIKIKYAKGDALYVPVTQLDLVSKYIGARDDSGIRLNKLGGTEWQKTRTRVRAAVKDMAKQLTVLYAKRMSVKGHAFSQDTDLQSDFERRFEFDETDDQLRCIDEIKKDMEGPVPMDRLLCGDVGFGKTEVALRAAFKCISEGKQCAMMAPTTILAWQHYNTVLRRMNGFPVEIRLLSRFVSKTAQSKAIAELRRGSADMVIGTHRIISNDVKFRDLGLIIIDEEHRFGVAQKEKLKELYPHVDVLTLSATPIPRTLNMAMSGLRDMSSIDEAPEDRQPVQTYVLEQDNSILADAIRKELRRGGQIYYLHNRVESLPACAARLKAAVPDARIALAHGKMDEEELSRVWQQLVEHEIDILVCTTIIETGVDVPNANTLIIENADRMGLSELHQLRGRVGRSPRRAYAYFCFKQGKGLSEVAEKRLEAIREYTEFGSGFKIAMRDLEIRGAGSVLGGEQHGHLESVGYDMYVRLLSDAIKEEKGEPVKEQNDCVIDINVSAHIPDSYIAYLPQRLEIYRRIADIRSDDDVSDVIDELCDRFGEPPKTVLGLIDVALIRNRAAALGIHEISQRDRTLILYVDEVDNSKMPALINEFGRRFMLGAGSKPYLAVAMPPQESEIDCLKHFLSVLG